MATGLPANALDNVSLDQTVFSDLPDLNSADYKLDVLQARALIERPDVLRLLAEYVVAEADLQREIEYQYSDIILSPGFIFDQDDKLWVLAGSWILPVNHRHQGPIAEAEARREVKAQAFLAYQAKVLRQVHEARIRYLAALHTYNETSTLIQELDDRSEKFQKQFDLGYTDRLAIIRNQLEILSAKRSQYFFELSAWREFANLEDALMTRLVKK